jgi:hypothetical protein
MAKRTGLATLRAFNADRRRALKLRLGEHGLAALIEAVGAIERSEFCRGQNDRNWRADFDFLVDPKKLVRVLEGKYGPLGATHAKPSSPTNWDEMADLAEKTGRADVAATFRAKRSQSLGSVVGNLVQQVQ